MTRTEIALIVCVVGALIAVLLAFSSRGPKVTTIETRHEKDGDDA